MSWYVLQTVMGAVGSLGFAILFGVRDRKLIPITAGGALAWSVYLVSVHKIGTDSVYGAFCGSTGDDAPRGASGKTNSHAGSSFTCTDADPSDSGRRSLLYDGLFCQKVSP